MQEILFYLLAGLVLLCAFLVVANPWTRNSVASAMFLVLTMLPLVGLFVLLHAFFLAAAQLMVYAGAVMVLFLFVVMSLNDQEREPSRFPWVRAGLAVLVVAALAWFLVKTMAGLPLPGLETLAVEGATAPLGKKLFTDFLLPFEMVSVLLLVAMLGVILLSKKELK